MDIKMKSVHLQIKIKKEQIMDDGPCCKQKKILNLL